MILFDASALPLVKSRTSNNSIWLYDHNYVELFGNFISVILLVACGLAAAGLAGALHRLGPTQEQVRGVAREVCLGVVGAG